MTVFFFFDPRSHIRSDIICQILFDLDLGYLSFVQLNQMFIIVINIIICLVT